MYGRHASGQRAHNLHRQIDDFFFHVILLQGTNPGNQYRGNRNHQNAD